MASLCTLHCKLIYIHHYGPPIWNKICYFYQNNEQAPRTSISTVSTSIFWFCIYLFTKTIRTSSYTIVTQKWTYRTKVIWDQFSLPWYLFCVQVLKTHLEMIRSRLKKLRLLKSLPIFFHQLKIANVRTYVWVASSGIKRGSYLAP